MEKFENIPFKKFEVELYSEINLVLTGYIGSDIASIIFELIKKVS